jgi:hypothetical protein
MFFKHYLITGRIFGKNVIEHKMCFISLQPLSETFLIPVRINRDIIKNVQWSPRKLTVLLVRFISKWNLNFIYRISENTPNTKFHQNPSSGSRVFPCGRTDKTAGQAHMTKLAVALGNFANAPKNNVKFVPVI